jgi:hypothetical protein
MSAESYSQYCEDIAIDNMLNHKQRGVYVDVGAGDPDLFSNTRKFYNRGWYGYLIEPDKKNHSKLVAERPADTIYRCAAGTKSGYTILYGDVSHTLSATDFKTFAVNCIKNRSLPVSIDMVRTAPLSYILRGVTEHIDLMSIDTE